MRLSQTVIFGCLILILTVNSIRGQQPIIENLFVEEADSVLVIRGKLSLVEGKVLVDSIPLKIKYWSDSLCQAYIPLSGRGAAGLVEVGANGYRSESKMLSSLWIEYSDGSFEFDATTGAANQSSSKQYYHFRIGIENLLINKTPSIKVQAARNSKSTYYHRVVDDQHHETIEQSEEVISGEYVFDVYKKIVSEYNLDQQYKPVYKLIREEIAHSHGSKTYVVDGGSTFLPRKEYVELSYTPVVSPMIANYRFIDSIILIWNTPALAQYELQIAKDSLFKDVLLDIFDSTVRYMVDDTLIPEIFYYWRVRVLSSVGNGPWSNVAKFKRSNEMRVGDINSSSLSLAPHPIVKSSIVTLQLMKDSFVKLRIYDLTGHEIQTMIDGVLPAGKNELIFNATRMDNGIYLYRLEVDKRTECGKIIISH